MQRVISGIIFMLCIFIAQCTKAKGYVNIDAKTLIEMVEKDPAIILVDARGSVTTTIRNAIPMSSNMSVEEIQLLLPDKNAKYIVYCGSTQCPASKNFLVLMKSLEYKNLWHYPGGVLDWEEQGYPLQETVAVAG